MQLMILKLSVEILCAIDEGNCFTQTKKKIESEISFVNMQFKNAGSIHKIEFD